MSPKRIAIICLILIAWHVLSSNHLIPAALLPSPLAILAAWRNRLAVDLCTTVGRAICGVIIGTVAAYSVHALAMRLGLGHLLDREVGISRAVPVVAMLPILIIWFGFSELARTAIVSFSALTMIFPMIHDSIRRLPRSWQLIGERGRLSWWRNYIEVQLPWSLPEVGSGLRIILAVALGVSIATEYMGAEHGVGKFLDSARGTFNLPGLWLGMLLVGVSGGLADRAIVAVKQRFLFWSAE